MQTFPLNNVEYNAEDMGAYFSTRVRGVYSSDTDFLVTRGSGSFGINIAPGRAWLSPNEFWGIMAWEKEAQTFTVAQPVSVRRTAIVLRFSVANNSTTIAFVNNADGDSTTMYQPVHTDEIDELVIASVVANFSQITIVTDLRADETYCGLMRDGVTGIPTEGLLEQAHRDFQDAIDDVMQTATDAASSAALAAETATEGGEKAESWAVGGTGSRPGEDTNNAKYWSDVAQGAAGGGVSTFNGRNGAVVPQAGDYTAAMVGAIPVGTDVGGGPKITTGTWGPSTRITQYILKQYEDERYQELSCVIIIPNANANTASGDSDQIFYSSILTGNQWTYPVEFTDQPVILGSIACAPLSGVNRYNDIWLGFLYGSAATTSPVYRQNLPNVRMFSTSSEAIAFSFPIRVSLQISGFY